MTDRYAVIRNPVAHSKSPEIHAEFARAAGEEVEYDRLLSPIGSFWRGVRPDTSAVPAALRDSVLVLRL